ncbi:MAG: hypothetical protein FWG81_01905 [Betaproteobacteria bacterium]|nr:hypothetical protein [Betaproteobacteria bacterium]
MDAKVNLLDCLQEPSDEQLDMLMREALLDARDRAEIANAALMDTLQKKIDEVCLRYEFGLEQVN